MRDITSSNSRREFVRSLFCVSRNLWRSSSSSYSCTASRLTGPMSSSRLRQLGDDLFSFGKIDICIFFDLELNAQRFLKRCRIRRKAAKIDMVPPRNVLGEIVDLHLQLRFANLLRGALLMQLVQRVSHSAQTAFDFVQARRDFRALVRQRSQRGFPFFPQSICSSMRTSAALRSHWPAPPVVFRKRRFHRAAPRLFPPARCRAPSSADVARRDDRDAARWRGRAAAHSVAQAPFLPSRPRPYAPLPRDLVDVPARRNLCEEPRVRPFQLPTRRSATSICCLQRRFLRTAD